MKDHTIFGLSSLVDQDQSRTYSEKNIFLTGFMGAGKTTVGQILAKALNRPFVDMDEELVRYHQKSIRRIFEDSGEAFFRQTETTLLDNLNKQDQPKVIATGGGIVLSPHNCQILKNALTFFLDLTAEEAWERIYGTDERPLATELSSFKNRLQSRLELYRKCGSVISANHAPEEVAKTILDFILWQDPFELQAEGKSCTIRTYAPASFLAEFKENLIGSAKTMVLMDHHFRDHPDEFFDLFPKESIIYTKKSGEEAKTMEEATELLMAMAEAKLDRSDFLVVRGGGSLTDLGALCAGLYRRGLNLVLIPTTVLAAVDASIGGKAAVNLAGAKNQVGLFYLPREVWIDPLVLKSLPFKLKCEGLIEAYKIALLFDPLLCEIISRQLTNILADDLLLLSQIIHDAVRHKAQVAAKDLREELGIRDVLNLGHTYGHVVESYNAPTVSHGQAVALGLAVALTYSVEHHDLDPFVARTGIDICRRLCGGDFPPAPPDQEAIRLLSFDKKIREGKLKFVAIKAPGHCLLDKSVEPESILKAARSLLKN
ncbi:MAG: AAA family ATPase [Deltaproteobacteria bacterium]|nr:AAA family ATPase [Deltaproteobacteria bacterium]